MPETNTVETPKPKFVLEYQITDEQGQPIIDPRTGKPMQTNLTAETPEEMFEKQKNAHINAVRLAARLRNQKPVAREPEAARKELSVEEERQAVADIQDPTKARAAVRKLTGADELEESNRKLKEMQDGAASQRAAYQFMSRHVSDYYPCEANSKAMSEEINAQGLDPRVMDNYEIAFANVQHRLAQRPAPPVAQPTPEPTPAPEPRRQAAGGIQPGELSGQRPIQRKKELVTKQQIAEWRKTPEGRAEYSKRMRDPAFVDAVNALFAKT